MHGTGENSRGDTPPPPRTPGSGDTAPPAETTGQKGARTGPDRTRMERTVVERSEDSVASFGWASGGKILGSRRKCFMKRRTGAKG